MPNCQYIKCKWLSERNSASPICLVIQATCRLIWVVTLTTKRPNNKQYWLLTVNCFVTGCLKSQVKRAVPALTKKTILMFSASTKWIISSSVCTDFMHTVVPHTISMAQERRSCWMPISLFFYRLLFLKISLPHFFLHKMSNNWEGRQQKRKDK